MTVSHRAQYGERVLQAIDYQDSGYGNTNLPWQGRLSNALALAAIFSHLPNSKNYLVVEQNIIACAYQCA